MMHWSAVYIGLPWRVRGRARNGVDCWGLCWLAWRANGFNPPSYAEDYADDREKAEIEALISGQSRAWPWQPVAPDAEQDFDFIAFRVAGLVSHVGLVAGQGRMLHIQEGGESCLVSYRDSRWSSRIDGIYRLAA